MWKAVGLYWIVCTSILAKTVLSGRTGKFQLNDDGVKGEGTYTLSNQTADINLHLIIGNLLRAPEVKAINVPMLKPALKDTADRTKSPIKIIGKESDNNHTKQENMEQKDRQAIKTVKQENVERQEKEPDKLVKQERLSDEDLTFALDGLEEHNRFRKIHGSIPMKLDRQMSLQAQDFARQLAKLGTLKHSARDSRPGQGENLAMGCSSGDSIMPASAATKKWYDEVCNYDFNNSTFQKPCGHFSQIIWKSTGSLGLGKAFGSKWGMNCTFIVARYGPQGNIANQIQDNVEKGSFDTSYCNTATRTTHNHGPEQTEDESLTGYYPDYGLNEGFLNDDGEGMKSIGFREKIPRVKPFDIKVL